MVWMECFVDQADPHIIYTTCPYCDNTIKLLRKDDGVVLVLDSIACSHFVRYDPLKNVALFEQEDAQDLAHDIAKNIKQLGENLIKLGDIYEQGNDVVKNISKNIAKVIEVALDNVKAIQWRCTNDKNKDCDKSPK
ncbi:MAG: hypothetical protein GXO10_03000 [Crenarchaeota archaeon]|nr:hypothetical protein [Thermoproteota archaeon]